MPWRQPQLSLVGNSPKRWKGCDCQPDREECSERKVHRRIGQGRELDPKEARHECNATPNNWSKASVHFEGGGIKDKTVNSWRICSQVACCTRKGTEKGIWDRTSVRRNEFLVVWWTFLNSKMLVWINAEKYSILRIWHGHENAQRAEG